MLFFFQTIKSAGFQGDALPIIAGLSNDYADYVTTYEEYQVQRKWFLFLQLMFEIPHPLEVLISFAYQ